MNKHQRLGIMSRITIGTPDGVDVVYEIGFVEERCVRCGQTKPTMLIDGMQAASYPPIPLCHSCLGFFFERSAEEGGFNHAPTTEERPSSEQ